MATLGKALLASVNVGGRVAVYDSRRLVDSGWVGTAALLDELAIQIGKQLGREIPRIPAPTDTAEKGSAVSLRMASPYPVIWNVTSAVVKPDSLVVNVSTYMHDPARPCLSSTQEADFYIVRSSAGWRVADVRRTYISDGACDVPPPVSPSRSR